MNFNIILSICLIALFIYLQRNPENIEEPVLIKTTYVNPSDPFKIQVSYPSFLINKKYTSPTIENKSTNKQEKELLKSLQEQIKNQIIEFKTPNNKNELEVQTITDEISGKVSNDVIIPLSSSNISFIGEVNNNKIEINYKNGNIFVKSGEILLKYKALNG